MRNGGLASGIASLTLAALCAASSPAFAAWQTDVPLPTAVYETKTVAGGRYVYRIGGMDANAICGTRHVYYAPLNADGSVGAWVPTTSLPSVGTSTMTWTCANTPQTVDNIVIGWGFEAVYWNGFVYIIGGSLWNFNGWPDGTRIHFSSAVYYASVNADGSLGNWQAGVSMSTASFDAAAAVANGTIYVTGGRDDSTTMDTRRDVFYARLNPDGSLQPWQTSANQMPGGLWLHAATVAQSRLYVSGGVTYYPFPPNQITNAVFSAPLAADGTPGVWRAESSLPIGLAGHAFKQRHGILYTLGGEEPTSPSVSVHVSSINVDGTLPPWTNADFLPAALYLHGAAALGAAVYADGGTNGVTPQSGVYHLPDTIPPSAAANLAAAALDSGALQLSWTAPGNDGAYGSVAGGRYLLSAATDPTLLAAATPTVWTASFDPGAPQSFRLAGLAPGTTYYLSLAAADESGNAGPASNVASARTYFLATSPENPPVVRLQSPTAGLTVSALSAAQSAPLLSGAPGAASVALYQIAPAAPLSPGLLSVAVPPSALTPGVALYEYLSGVGWSSAAVAGQTVDPASGVVRGALAQTGIVGVFGPWPVPALSSLSPSLVDAGGPGFALTATGAGFAPSSVVRWNGSPRATTYVSATQLSAAISAADVAAPGSAAVTVFTPAPGGGTSASAAFTIGNPVPAISSLSPAAATAGAAGLSLTVNGAGFVSGAVVQWNGAARATTFVSATQLTAALSATDLAAAGAGSVTAVNPAPGGGASAPVSFSVVNPAPSIASLAPSAANAGGAAFALTVNGAGFVASSAVRWNGSPRATTFVSASQLTAAISAADIASTGTVSVTAVNPAPGGGTAPPASFTIAVPPPQAPVLAAIGPSVVTAGSGALTLTASGANFVPSSVVQWNGAPRATSFVSPVQLTAAIAATDVASAGSAALTVFTPAPGGGTSSPVTLTVANPAPSIASLAPASATAGTAAFALTVGGAGFVAGSVVQWNGSARATTFVSASQLTAAIAATDALSAGSAAVTVVSPAPGGGASAPASFAVLNPVPAIASLSPAAAAAGSAAFTLTVNGSGFVAGSLVRWNGAQRATTFVSPSQLSAAISSADVAAAGSDSVDAVTPAPGGGASAAAAFTVSAPVACGGASAGGDDDERGRGDDGERGAASTPACRPAPIVTAEVEPETLNLGSEGPPVHVAVEARSWARSEDIDVAGLRLTAVDGRPAAPLAPRGATSAPSRWDDAAAEDFVFDRAAIAALLDCGRHALTFSGTLKDGRAFAATASLEAVQPRSGRGMSAAALRAAPELSAPSSPETQPRFWPAPAPLLALRTMAWDADPPFMTLSSAVVSGRVSVRVPDGAVAPSVQLTISTRTAAAAPDLDRRAAKSQAAGLTAAAPAVQFGPEGTRFATPVTLEMPYDRASLPAGVDEGALAVHYWNPAAAAWEKLPSFVDREAQVVRAQTSHFSLYQVFSAPSVRAIVVPAAADPSLSFKAAYAFPNPVRGASAVTIRAQPGQADSVEVHVYDLSGRRVHSSSDFTSRGAFDDGNGLGQQYTYDHVWDVSGVGSGVYTYVITARKAGQADIHKSGKIGVIK